MVKLFDSDLGREIDVPEKTAAFLLDSARFSRTDGGPAPTPPPATEPEPAPVTPEQAATET